MSETTPKTISHGTLRKYISKFSETVETQVSAQYFQVFHMNFKSTFGVARNDFEKIIKTITWKFAIQCNVGTKFLSTSYLSF